MPSTRRPAASRWRSRVIVVVTIAAVVVLSHTAVHAQGRSEPVDGRIGATDCRLLGRAYVAGRGCSRDRCVAGAHLAKAATGAEVCALARQGGYSFGSAVDYRRCAALHRRWLAQVNWCASNPDRSVGVIAHAPQCTGSATTYVTHTEREGHYDECVPPALAAEYARLARREGSTTEQVALQRSRTLCAYRPQHVFDADRCVPGTNPDVVPGGVLLVGDSIAWRGTDEPGRLRPDFALDGYPARRLSDLEARLDWFRLDHGDPDGLIVELGTNASQGFRKADLGRILGTLPPETQVMMVLPYRQNPHAPPTIQPSSTRYTAWMRELAAERAHTCVADWRAEVAAHPHLLVDGVHPTSAGETSWARWIAARWSSC